MALITRLFVGNLPENFNENALKNAFSSYGEITNFDLKCKPGLESDNRKRFAFVTLSASNFNVESCIKYFSNEDFHGNRLYVTRARESFLERLQREREQSQNKSDEKNPEVNLPIKKKNNGEHHNTHKRKFDEEDSNDSKHIKKSKGKPVHEMVHAVFIEPTINQINHISYEKQLNNTFHDKQNKKSEYSNKKNDNMFQNDEKKQNSDKKRQESIKKKKQEFNEKKNIIKTGLVSIDKQSNKKIIFSDTEEISTVQENSTVNGHIKQNNLKPALFDDGGSDDEINFEVKKQFEGKKGQKVLDLQSRYKSDKRFVLDERFVEESDSEKDEGEMEQEKVDLNQVDEKSKQLNILQDLLGVTIKSKSTDTTNKTKPKLGMLRFDPAQPDHAKYLVPVTAQEQVKKSKKKKGKETKEDESHKEPENVEKVEVSKEQFYKISDSLKETMTQPTTFSLRSLFRKDDDEQQQEGTTEDVNYIPLQTKKDTKVKNPLDPGEKNPFQYDSSESENEEHTDANDTMKIVPETKEIKTVWREKLFLSKTDPRLKDGLIFFGKSYENEGQKDRRELKSLMKKRINNKERKNTMFQKKIGGRKKTIRKKYRKN